MTEQVCDGLDISHEEAGNWEEQTHGNLLVHFLPCGYSEVTLMRGQLTLIT